MLEYYCVFMEDIPYTQHEDGPFENTVVWWDGFLQLLYANCELHLNRFHNWLLILNILLYLVHFFMITVLKNIKDTN
jgi:hypothetical protein